MKYLIVLFSMLGAMKCVAQTVDPDDIPNSEFEIQEELARLKDRKIPNLEYAIERYKIQKVDLDAQINNLQEIAYDENYLMDLDTFFVRNEKEEYLATLSKINLIYLNLIGNESGYDEYGLYESNLELRKIENQLRSINQKAYNRRDYYILRDKIEDGDLALVSVQHKSFGNYNKEHFEKAKNDILRKTKEYQSKIGELIKAKESEIKLLNLKVINLRKAIEKGKKSINLVAIQLGLPLFCLTIILLFISPLIIRAISKNPEQFQGRTSSVLLELITVFLLTMTILILGLGNILQSEVLGTLIGGISGYVLNKISNGNMPNNNDSSPNTTTSS